MRRCGRGMFWFNPTEIYKRQFQPAEEGYLFYPRRNKGGKLLSHPEYEKLVLNYRRWMGTRFVPGLSLWLVLAGSIVIASISVMFDLPELFIKIAVYVMVAAFLAAYSWLYLAPYRLTKNRAAISPPRTRQEQLRQGRTMFPWALLIWIIFIFGFFSIFGIAAAIAEPSIGKLVFEAVCVVIFIMGLRVAIQKYRDRP